MSPKQIRHFGTKRQRAALKASRTRKRATSHRAAPRKRAANPAQLLILGNPRTVTKRATKKRRKTGMAATRKQLAALRKARAARKRMAGATANPRRRRRANRHRIGNPRRRRMNARRRNGTKVYVLPRRNGRRGARRNPEVFGLTGVNAGKAIVAGLVGVYAAKTVTPIVAGLVPQVGSSSIIAALVSAVVGWGGGMLVGKWDKTAGAGFMFGAWMQAGSQLLNSVVSPNPLSLSGLGDFVAGGPVGLFPVMNPIRAAAMARAQGMLAPPTGAPQNNLAGMAASQMFL